MKAKKAIKILKSINICESCIHINCKSCKKTKAVKLAIKALERSIPRNLIYDDCGYSFCPSCKTEIELDINACMEEVKDLIERVNMESRNIVNNKIKGE